MIKKETGINTVYTCENKADFMNALADCYISDKIRVKGTKFEFTPTRNLMEPFLLQSGKYTTTGATYASKLITKVKATPLKLW